MYQPGMKLFVGTKAVKPGMEITWGGGVNKGTVDSIAVPHKPSSTGRVYIHVHGQSKYCQEYFPGVIDAEWKFPCQMEDCNGSLKFEAAIGAPGKGQSWKCETCGEAHWLYGGTILPFKYLDGTDVELDPSSVI